MTDDYVMVPREALEAFRTLVNRLHTCRMIHKHGVSGQTVDAQMRASIIKEVDGSWLVDAQRALDDIDEALLSAAPPPPAREAVSDNSQNNATRLLRQAYVTLAFAFNRLHESPRSRDGELCSDFQKMRAAIEAHFKAIGVKL